MAQTARQLPKGHPGRQLVDGREAQLAKLESCWELLTARGWGLANLKVAAITEAGALLQSGNGAEADERLAQECDERFIGRIISRVERGITNGIQMDTRNHRSRLLTLAQRHHERGEYAASIMIVLAQAEGITAQVTARPEGGRGRMFFSRSPDRMADVVDASDLASIPAGLPALRKVYSEGVDTPQIDGSVSRHGILHGQELAYDTKINSAKVWSLLDVLVQWAVSRAWERESQADMIRPSAFAGSDAADERGRRLDNREFKTTRRAMYDALTAAAAYSRRNRRLDVAAIGDRLSPAKIATLGLPREHGIQVHASGDRCLWLTRKTVSGWWLGRAVTISDLGGGHDTWYFSGPQEPIGGPIEVPGEWGTKNVAPPDWQG